MGKIFYIDPQSYNNLSMYDFSLLSAVKGHELVYYYSDLYQLKTLPSAVCRKRFSYSHRKSGILKGLSYVSSMLGIAYDVWRERPDVIHIQWLRLWHLDYLLLFFFQRCGCKVVFTAHNILPHITGPDDKSHYTKYYKHVDAIIVHNEGTRLDLSSQLGIDIAKIHVIRHGMFEPSFTEDEVENRSLELKQKFGLSSSTIVFSALGVQKPYKGIIEIVEAWSSSPMLSQSPHCHLLIAGRNHGIDYSPVSALQNVTIIDEMIPDLDFEAFLDLSSVVLLPYRKISQSGLLFSCINRERPVLITQVGGLPEALKIGEIGWNIGTLSVESLQRKMIELVENPQLIENVKSDTRAFDALRNAHDWDEIGQHTARLYSMIATNK